MQHTAETIYRLAPLLEEHCRDICEWSYPPPYDVFAWRPWEQMLAGQEEFADPALRNEQYRAVLTGDGELCGFAQFFPLGGVTRLGLGMRPELCGSGSGSAFALAIAREAQQLFPGHEIDLEVLTWNERAIRAYRKAGFVITDTYEKRIAAGIMTFHCMVWTAKEEGYTMQEETLAHIAAALQAGGVEWGLGGSAMLYYYGLEKRPNDFDLLIAKEDAGKAREWLSMLGERTELPSKEPFCTAHFDHYRIDGVETDVLGLFGIRHAEGVYRLDWRSDPELRTVRVGQADAVVPLTALEDWYVLYLLMDRPARVQQIEEYWRGHGGLRRERFNAILARELPEAVRGRIRSLLSPSC